jgi:hypothetical protein
MITTFQTRHPIKFDVENVEHKKHFYKFLLKNKWDKKAPLFLLEDDWLDVPNMILYKLTLHNLKKEFKR